MRILLLLLSLWNISYAASGGGHKLVSAYFDRPLNCPLRFSNLSGLRDQIQTLTSSLGNGCTQNGQQALKQLNTSVGNLEGIATTWSTQQGTDQKAQNAQLAKNASQVLGSLNIITSNTECFYDIRSRGTLPVVSDVVMSLSQLGLLIPSTTGTLVATGGYLAGSGMKIINELVKKKFNWNRPEERRAFLELNCAFFDNRRIMEEMGLFTPETKSFRSKLIDQMRTERLTLIKLQKSQEAEIIKNQKTLDDELMSVDEVKEAAVSPVLVRKLEELNLNLSSRPADHASKWKQLTILSEVATSSVEMLRELKLEGPQNINAAKVLLNNFEIILPDLVRDGKAWNVSIDEYEMKYRGPIIAFAGQVASAVKNELVFLEAIASSKDKSLAERLSQQKIDLRESRAISWGASQRLFSIEARISSLENAETGSLFSKDDQGKSDAVEILDHYRKLQKSILGKEGKGYLKNSLERMDDVLFALNKQIGQFDESETQREKCASAEKLRFVWAQYRYTAQESYDFVATNQDLSFSSYKIGKEKQKRSSTYVLAQISSVEDIDEGNKPFVGSVGYYMSSVRSLMDGVESRLQGSGCF